MCVQLEGKSNWEREREGGLIVLLARVCAMCVQVWSCGCVCVLLRVKYASPRESKKGAFSAN